MLGTARLSVGGLLPARREGDSHGYNPVGCAANAVHCKIYYHTCSSDFIQTF